MLTRRIRAAAALAAIALLTACSNGSQPRTPPEPDDVNGLAGCGPLTIADIEKFVTVKNLRQLTSPTICTWTGRADNSPSISPTAG